jgi:hypothetical protein
MLSRSVLLLQLLLVVHTDTHKSEDSFRIVALWGRLMLSIIVQYLRVVYSGSPQNKPNMTSTPVQTILSAFCSTNTRLIEFQIDYVVVEWDPKHRCLNVRLQVANSRSHVMNRSNTLRGTQKCTHSWIPLHTRRDIVEQHTNFGRRFCGFRRRFNHTLAILDALYAPISTITAPKHPESSSFHACDRRLLFRIASRGVGMINLLISSA